MVLGSGQRPGPILEEFVWYSKPMAGVRKILLVQVIQVGLIHFLRLSVVLRVPVIRYVVVDPLDMRL